MSSATEVVLRSVPVRMFRRRCGSIAWPVLLALVQSAGAGESGETPLARLERFRSAEQLRTARIEWSSRSYDRDQSHLFRERFYTWQAAGERHLSTDLGDEEHVLQRDPEGRPIEQFHGGPIRTLVEMSRLWSRSDQAPFVDVRDTSMKDVLGVSDLRLLGVYPQEAWDTIEARLKAMGMPPFRYSTSEDDGLLVVKAESRDSAFAWWLDPNRDYNPVRIATFQDGQLLGERRITLERFDGVWFPRRVEHIGRDNHGVFTTLSLIEVHAAEFNRPEHPQELGPRDVGLEPGMAVFHKGALSAAGQKYWDGEKPVSPEEYFQRVAAGELSPGPTVVRELARLQARHARVDAEANPPPRPEPTWDSLANSISPEALWRWRRADTLWEAYTRAFIARYRLDDEQAQLAWRTCRECQEEARAHVERVRPELEQAERLLADATDDLQRMKARAELTLLVRPLDEIFTRRLQPKLEKLPTRAQRAAVAETSAAPPLSTRPAAAAAD